jgi:acyl-CoA synthetase (AMP-forming)/AMP-acid ligase II
VAVTSAGGEPRSLAEIALLRLAHDPGAPFLLTIDEDEPREVMTRTYGEVGARILAVAEALRAAGVQPGDTIGCYLANTPCWVVGSFGGWWAGAAIAAVGTLLPGPEATRLFEMAGVRVVVALDGHDLPGDFDVIPVDEEGALVGRPPAVPLTTAPDVDLPDPESLAALFFTSGTTGQPKGISYTHEDCVVAGQRIATGYAKNTTYRPESAPAHLSPGVVFNAFGHTAGFVRLAFRMWIGRATLLIPKFTVPAIAAYVERFAPDSLQLQPATIHMLATADQDIDLSSVAYVTSSTAPLSTATRDLFEQRYGCPVLQAYGMTEVGTVAQERLEDVQAGRRGPGSVGRPARGVELKIRPLADQDRPDGEGEILVRTKAMPAEFVGGAKVPVDEEGWFATGDIGRYEDGILSITGRAQEKIIVGGFNVYPAEVEDAMKRSPLVLDALLVGVPDDRLGERPVAGIVWAGEPDEAKVLEELRAVLAPYKLPRQTFALDALPLTPRDKVDRKRAMALAVEALGPEEARWPTR